MTSLPQFAEAIISNNWVKIRKKECAIERRKRKKRTHFSSFFFIIIQEYSNKKRPLAAFYTSFNFNKYMKIAKTIVRLLKQFV
jgi:hypothetical protein